MARGEPPVTERRNVGAADSPRRRAVVGQDCLVPPRFPSPEQRRYYVMDKDVTARDEASRACAAVLQLLRQHLRLVVVDAYTDYDDKLTADARQAQESLRRLGAGQGRRPWWRRNWPADPGMGIEMDPTDDQQWNALCAYAAWSINLDLYGPEREDLGGFYDSGHSIGASLTAIEARQLSVALADIGPLTLLDEFHARRKQQQEVGRIVRRLGRDGG
jgi:hypothetical protein